MLTRSCHRNPYRCSSGSYHIPTFFVTIPPGSFPIRAATGAQPGEGQKEDPQMRQIMVLTVAVMVFLAPVAM
ncbi:MAG TPA: hypothetical protein PLZ55_06415, partial [bacterium]|nr:hypothetical protein [bacterium]